MLAVASMATHTGTESRGGRRERAGEGGYMLGLAILLLSKLKDMRRWPMAVLVSSLFVFNLFKKTCLPTWICTKCFRKVVLTRYLNFLETLLKGRGLIFNSR